MLARTAELVAEGLSVSPVYWVFIYILRGKRFFSITFSLTVLLKRTFLGLFRLRFLSTGRGGPPGSPANIIESGVVRMYGSYACDACVALAAQGSWALFSARERLVNVEASVADI